MAHLTLELRDLLTEPGRADPQASRRFAEVQRARDSEEAVELVERDGHGLTMTHDHANGIAEQSFGKPSSLAEAIATGTRDNSHTEAILAEVPAPDAERRSSAVTAVPVETIQSTDLILNALPGEPVPYYLASGEGARFETAGQLWTVIARSQDSGGSFDAAFIEGRRGARSPSYALSDVHRTYTVFSGEVEIDLGGERRRLTRGDSVQVPEGIPFAYRFLAHLTRVFVFSAPGGMLDALLESSKATQRHIYSAQAGTDELVLPTGAIRFNEPSNAISDVWDERRPAGVQPYALRSLEGDHREWPDTMNTLQVRGENTGGRYFMVHTLSARQPYIIRHFHQRHTENFLCMSGRIWLWVNGKEVLLTEGDFLHAPAGTVHSFAVAANNSRMLGVLTTDIFEPFFDVTAVANDSPVYSEGLVDPGVLFGGIQANPDLDLVIAGPPPERVLGPEL